MKSFKEKHKYWINKATIALIQSSNMNRKPKLHACPTDLILYSQIRKQTYVIECVDHVRSNVLQILEVKWFFTNFEFSPIAGLRFKNRHQENHCLKFILLKIKISLSYHSLILHVYFKHLCSATFVVCLLIV